MAHQEQKKKYQLKVAWSGCQMLVNSPITESPLLNSSLFNFSEVISSFNTFLFLGCIVPPLLLSPAAAAGLY